MMMHCGEHVTGAMDGRCQGVDACTGSEVYLVIAALSSKTALTVAW